MNFYKIRNIKTGLYSTGGTCPRFTKYGKTWKELHHVKAHLKLLDTHYTDINNLELVVLTLMEASSIPISKL